VEIVERALEGPAEIPEVAELEALGHQAEAAVTISLEMALAGFDVDR
jgi:hypothetical protein